ncbi:alpha/beta hydrolase [Flavobacterium cyanobacteriorum]|uniref:Alpha/beta hydrolase n=1 Tax=Flavobacterium cyanobacteriorum TaxID=2022802 RepID=A0A255YRK9_9FLAO|nr:alpha/beta hydrolase [Flavobacterium cyanobacteriorum]OYQ31853.1 alpha/beta hydrolase [Flavobacterium cyanobacteriorum]
MKYTLTALAFITTIAVFAQDITGKWNGAVTLPQGDLPIILNITKNENGYSATMDSPMQGAKDIPLSLVTFKDNLLTCTLAMANFTYEATYDNDMFKGTLTQNGYVLPLNLKRGAEPAKKIRPQEPAKPYPYYTEDVTFKNDKAGITLAGTLSLPKKEGAYPVVVLISGSGGQNRDEELAGHKPFLVLADHLTRNGIGVLRFDDRGVAQSGGQFETATTADFVTDARAAVQYLKSRKDVNHKKIGLAGHSEGGTVATMLAAGNPDIAFLILMAGGNIAGSEQMVLQNYLIGKAQGMPEEELARLGIINRKIYDVLRQEKDKSKMESRLYEVMERELKPLFISKGIPEAEVKRTMKIQAEGLLSDWYIYFINNDPAPYLEKVKCPILAINGDKDLQVAPAANLDAVKRAAEKSGNKKVTVKLLHGLNHLLQEAGTGMPTEYSSIEQTLSPVALSEIVSWIKIQMK